MDPNTQDTTDPATIAARRPDEEGPAGWQAYMERQFTTIHKELKAMTDALTQIAEEETELVAVVGEIVTAFEADVAKIASLEQTIASGGTVSAEEVKTLGEGFASSISKLKALLPAEPAKPKQTVYEFSGEGTPPPATWPTSGFETVPAAGETAKLLYYFSGDTTPTDTNGAGQPGWTVYTGAVQAVPVA